MIEDTPQGRYAGVLFTTASKEEHLFAVLEDMKSLKELYNQVNTYQSKLC